MNLLRFMDGWAGWIFGAGVVVLLFWHWRGWRLNFAAARSMRARIAARAPLKENPRVSVLVAAWNEAAIIADHIRSFQALRYPHKELVVGAGGKDGTFEAARALAGEGVHVFEQKPGQGKQATLREGYAQTGGDILFLTDSDSVLTDQAFENTLAPLINEGATVATGRMHPLPSQMQKPFVLLQWFTTLYNYGLWGETTTGLLGCNIAVRRAAVDEIGAFEADVRTGTDYHMAQELLARGHQIRFVVSSSVQTEFPETLGSYRRRQTRWIRNVVTHGLYYHDYREVRHGLITSVIGLGMLLGPVLVWIFGLIALAGWGLLWIHVLASRVRYMRFGEVVSGVSFGRGYLMLPLYTLYDFYIWASVLPQYASSVSRRQW